MASSEYKVFIIDDHPLISEAYKSAFNHYSKQDNNIIFKINVAHNCDDAYNKILEFSENRKPLDIVFLDIKLPPSKDGEILSGEDLGLRINELFPSTKIIVATTFNDNYRIHSIFKNINPDGFLTKNDITPKELITAIDTIINDPPYYSKSIIKLLRKEVSSHFLLDDIDRKMLYELSIGTRMKDLPNIIPLSIAALEKRKRHIKQAFNVSTSDDKELLYVAREKGFI